MELYLVVFIVLTVVSFLAIPPSSPADAKLSAQFPRAESGLDLSPNLARPLAYSTR